jgi:hypothetical protein
VSVAASDDVDASTTTDPSVTEQDSNIEDKSTTSPKLPSATASKGPVQLLRRLQHQQQSPSNSSSTPSRQQGMTNSVDMTARLPSPTRIDMHAPVKETVDPSLLEAFANPMNRQYLLQLEANLNNFVTQSRYEYPHSF